MACARASAAASAASGFATHITPAGRASEASRVTTMLSRPGRARPIDSHVRPPHDHGCAHREIAEASEVARHVPGQGARVPDHPVAAQRRDDDERHACRGPRDHVMSPLRLPRVHDEILKEPAVPIHPPTRRSVLAGAAALALAPLDLRMSMAAEGALLRRPIPHGHETIPIRRRRHGGRLQRR